MMMCFFFLFFAVSRLLLLTFSMRNPREFSSAHFSGLFTFLRFYFYFSVCCRPHEMYSPFRRKIGIAYASKASQVVVYAGMSITGTGEKFRSPWLVESFLLDSHSHQQFLLNGWVHHNSSTTSPNGWSSAGIKNALLKTYLHKNYRAGY